MRNQNILFKIHCCTCIFLFIHYGYSQNPTGYVKYDYTPPIHYGKYDFRPSSKKDPKTKNSKLLFNKQESLFVYDKLSMVDSTSSTFVFSTKGAVHYPIKADEKGFLIYRNFKAQEIQFRVPKIVPLEAFTVEDNWLTINWEIKSNYKTIQGYTCQKAVGEFRGRKYKVWFTREIPLPYGPWKLFGLPGLILEAKDTHNQVKIELVEVCYPCKIDMEIKKPIEKEHKTIKEYVAYDDYKGEVLEKDMQATIDSIMQGKEDVYIKMTLNNPTTKKFIKEMREHQMEIIYEWEDYPGDTPSPFAKEKKEKASQELETFPKTISIESERN